MQWQRTEFLFKGIYLGLLVFIALQKPTWQELAYVGGCTLTGLVVFLVIAALRKIRQGYRPRGRPLSFLLFLLLENPVLVYAGVLLGAIGGAYVAFYNLREVADRPEGWVFGCCVLIGAILGGVFFILRHVEKKKVRLWMSLALAAALAGGGIVLLQIQLQKYPDMFSDDQRFIFGCLLLMGIPPFYLLTFASLVEESEVEVGVMCAALGVGLWLVLDNVAVAFGETEASLTLKSLALLLAVAVYLFYTWHILPSLRVFKHVFRGMSYASVGRFRWALLSLGRALQLDAGNKLAQEELWNIHRQMDFDEISKDEETLALVNFELCAERAAYLLMEPPTPAHLDEADRLLNLVSGQIPEMSPRCDYWRAVSHLHQGQHEQAAECLERVISGSDSETNNPHRSAILFPAWRLALLDHSEMLKRVGEPQLEQPGRRMEAIAVVERQLDREPTDVAGVQMKQILYHDLSESDYADYYGPEKAAKLFDHSYVGELGAALIGDASRWRRGAEYLRMAARGMPESGPSIYVQIAKASEKAEDYKGAWENYERAKQVGQMAGPQKLAAEDQKIYFQVIKMLADSAMERDEVDKAIENYRLYLESPTAGLETYRTLADLYERKEDVWSALHATEHAFIHGKQTDADLKARKDKYYYSIAPGDLRSRWESVQKWFDFNYCVEKARTLLERHAQDPDLIDWAAHLIELALVAQPKNMTVHMLKGRVHRLRGELSEATEILEEIYNNKPERFGSSEEEESWYSACKVLGDLYLNENPEKALECFQEYKKFPKSGADTYYKLGVAYEALGDWTRAGKCYQQVTAYSNHPLAPSAHDALDRLRAASG